MRISRHIQSRLGEPAWVFGDQALSGASNVLVPILVAREATPASFGLFAIAWAALLFLLTLMRSATSIHISLAADDPDLVTKETRHASGAIVLLAPLSIFVVAGLAFISAQSLSAPVLVVALATPIVLLQDVQRYRAFARGHVRSAFTADAVWFSLVGVAVVLSLTIQIAPVVIVLLWALGAITACVILWERTSPPIIRGIRQWLSSTWAPKATLSLAAVISAGSVALASTLVARIAGLDTLGAYAAASQLMAPINTLLATLGIWLIPRAVRRAPHVRFSMFARAGLVVSGLTACWSFVLLLLPTPVGTALLGATWPSARLVLPFVCLQFTIGVFAIAGGNLILSLGANRAVATQSIVLGIGRVTAAVATASVIGTAIAVSLGETAVLVIAGVMVWLIAWRLVHKRQQPNPIPST